MARFEMSADLDEVLEESGATRKATMSAGRRIAKRTDQIRRMQTTPDRYGDIETVETDDGAQTAATGPMAHLEEFGSVNNPAYMSMRRAVVAEGYRLK